MLIMNQNKDAVYNMEQIKCITAEKERVYIYIDDGQYGISVGTYASESRTKAVLLELFNAYSSTNRSDIKFNSMTGSIPLYQQTPKSFAFEMPAE